MSTLIRFDRSADVRHRPR